MAKPTLSEISKLFKTDDKPTDFHYYGTVVSADTDNRTYEVSINRDKNITVEAARLVGAHVGDTVMVTVMANGYATVTGRVGGDTDASDAQRKADSASTIADQAQTKAISALSTATEADQLANQAKQLADQAERNASRSADAAYNSEQSAQESAESAARSATAADTAERNAASSKTASETAQQNAANSQTAAEAARDRAISAEGYAQQANTYAQQANTHADEALVSAGQANEAANAAVNSVSIVEDVAGTLQWIQDHGTYTVTADTTVQNGKVYFIYNSTTQDYEPIATPDTTKNPHTEGWYELDISDSQTEYIMAHLAVTSQGLWVLPSGLGQAQSERYAPGWKLLLANDGAYVYDNNGVLTAKYSSNIEFDTLREHKIGNANQYIRYYNKNGQYKIDIVADSITLSGSNVATTLSNLAAADTDQTNALNAYKTSNDAAVSSLNTHISDTDTDLANYITSNNQAIENLQGQIDGSIQTWFYEVVPTNNNPPAVNWTTTELKNNHLGDLYYDTITGYCYRYQVQNNIYGWQRITDVDVTKALADAAKAQDTADHKRRVFVAEPTPPYDVGDLWVQGQNGDIKRCATAKTSQQTYSSSDWLLASKYTDDSAVTALAGNVYTKSEVYTKQNIDTKIGEINTTITSKETTIKQYADGKASAAETAAKTYADGKASTAETNAKTYADNNFDSKGSAASALDDAKDYADDNFDSKGSASAAQAAAISAAAADATSKANNAKDAAISSAATDATTKANNAKNAAISAAATDATSKANAAKQAAIDDAASKYYTKTQTYTKSEVDQKAGEISLSVSRDEVSKIQVGGRNLALNSKKLSTNAENTNRYVSGYNTTATESEETEFAVAKATSNWQGLGIFINSQNPKAGEEFCFSAYMYTSGGSASISFYLMCYDSSGNRVYPGDCVVDGAVRLNKILISNADFTIPRKLSAVFSLSEAAIELLDNGGKIRVTFQAHGFASGASVYMYAPKLERGTKATDWTPAPEDMESYTDAAISEVVPQIGEAQTQATEAAKAYSNEILESFSSKFKVSPEDISSEVVAIRDGETLVSRINQLPDSVKIEAKNVEIVDKYESYIELAAAEAAPYILLGKRENNAMLLRITNERMGFEVNSEEVAYLAPDALHVQKQISFGDFIMKQRENGHLSIIRVTRGG